MQVLFETLRDFVYPNFFEKGPPQQVRGFIASRYVSPDLRSDLAKGSILELIALGYRPATSLAILSILSESPTVALHGMQIARELEKRFEANAGWFTESRYYSDRVGRTLKLLKELEILQETRKTGSRGKRIFSVYQVRPELLNQVKTSVSALSKNERVSLFSGPRLGLAKVGLFNQEDLKECDNCKIIVNSTSARYCERCAGKLRMRCPACHKRVEVFDYCILCGQELIRPMSLLDSRPALAAKDSDLR